MTDETITQTIQKQVGQLGVDVLFSEKGHFADARRWRIVHRWLGLPAAVLAAVAGGTFLADTDSPIIPAIIAFLSAILTGVATFLKPDEIATRHHNVGVSYGALRRRIRHFTHVDCVLPGRAVENLVSSLSTLTEDVNALQKDAPAISNWARGEAYRQIKSGSSEYTQEEIVAAVGTSLEAR